MIASIQNNKVKKWFKYRQKKYRDLDQKFIIEGEHLIQEALASNHLEQLIVLDGIKNRFIFDNVEYVSEEVMRKLSTNQSLNKYIAIAKFIDTSLESNHILLLDGIQNPSNLGTILRSALAFGFRKIYISKNSADIYNEKVVQASQGAIFYLDIIKTDLLEIVSESEHPIYATGFENSVELSSIPKPKQCGIIFGNEGKGVSESLLKRCDAIINIKMSQFDSLNVAIAASIVMYQWQQ